MTETPLTETPLTNREARTIMLKSRSYALPLLLLVCALLTACSTQTEASAPAAPAAERPQFTANTVDGRTFSAQSLAGKPAVLWFWAPWCPNCQAEAPTVAKAAQQNPKVTFVGVAAQDDLAEMQKFVAEYRIGGFVHLADLEGSIWRQFGITHQPAYAFIKADGSVEVVKSMLSEQELTQRLGAVAGT